MAGIPVVSEELPPSRTPASHAVRAGDFVFVAGQAAIDDSGSHAAGSFKDEMDLAMSNARRILRVAGGGLEDVVQVRAYLGDSAFREEYNVLYRTYFRDPFPARTTIPADLGALKFEIDMVAYIPQ